MCRNKKVPAVIAAMLLTVSFTGCSAIQGLITDTGSGGQQEIAKENYLKQDIGQGALSADSLYQVVTLEKSDFSESVFSQMIDRQFNNVKTVTLDVEGVEAYFGEYLVGNGDYVKKGDPVATVYLQVNPVEAEELSMRLQRLQSRHAQDETDYNKDIQEFNKALNKTKDTFEKQLIQLDIHKRQLDWQYNCDSYAAEVEDIQKEMERRAHTTERYTVCAQYEGQIMIGSGWAWNGIEEGRQIDTRTSLCTIQDLESVFLNSHLVLSGFNYGKPVRVKNSKGEMMQGSVVNGDYWMLYGNLYRKDEPQVIRLDISAEEALNGSWNNLALNTNVNEVRNVIQIPEKAVTREEESYYVTVLKEDGTLQKTKFLPGGKNNTDYWVLEGLEEGMQIVY